MTDSPILEKIGLTRPQVMHLTRDMRLPFDDIRGPDEEKIVEGVAAITSDTLVEDAELEKLVTNEIKLRARIKAAVLRARGEK